MATEAISVRLQVGGDVYMIDLVGDPSDTMFAVQVGNSVASALITHDAAVRDRNRKP